MKRQLLMTIILILALVAQSFFTTGLTRTTQAAVALPQYVVVDLGTLGGSMSFAQAINNYGQIVGGSSLPGDPVDALGNPIVHAFLYSNGLLTDLGTLGGDSSYANAINDAGQVAGVSFLPGNPMTYGDFTRHGFLYSGGAKTDLGTLGGPFGSAALGINDAGWIAGESSLPGPPDAESLHAFVYQGSMVDLGTLPGDTYSSAAHINAAGQVVGWSVPADFNTYRGFLWSNGVMQDLNALIPANSGWQISFASGINDFGQIVGVGVRNGQSHAVLLIAPAFSIGVLADLVQSFDLPQGIKNSLLMKLQNAIGSANAGDLADACNQLQAFVNQVSAQAGNQIPATQANQLLTVANQLRASLGCR